jgi:3-oxoacyl-[acyl-carrier-protein] synthase III
MAFFTIPNVQIDGIVSCVPKTVQLVKDCECLSEEEAVKLSASTGIYERRIADQTECTSDLCIHAAEDLITNLQWDRSEIEALVFVTQTPDYILPATSPIIQDKLGLNTHCFTLDISLGCSGYVYGLITLANLMAAGNIKKALLLVGDTVTKICSPLDKSTYPLFGDAGTASALSFNPLAPPILANLYSDGKGYKSIIINHGGSRNPFKEQSLATAEVSAGIMRSPVHLVLEGMDVFSFGISKAPEVVKELFSKFSISVEAIDYFIFHQANMMMNEKIRKKLGIAAEKVPYSLAKFGNTSCATIPHTITTELSFKMKDARLLLCGFGVGLSWGAVYLQTTEIKHVNWIEL